MAALCMSCEYGMAALCTEMRIQRSSVVSRGFQANLTPPESLMTSSYLFSSVHFVEEKTFSNRLEICLQMSTKMSRNAPKVVHFIKKNSAGGGGGGHARRLP